MKPIDKTFIRISLYFMTIRGGFNIKQIIGIAALLMLITGCAGVNTPNRQQPAPDQAEAPEVGMKSNLTQASSISTPNAEKSSVKMKHTGNWDWGNWFNPGYPPAQNQPQTQNPQYPQSPQNTANSSQFPQQVLNLVNQERSKAGLQSLSMNGSLSNVATVKAQDMINNNYFSHQSPTYGSPFDMMRSFGISFRAAGENIAKGQRSPSEVMTQWMNSPGHRANILNGSFTQIGVGYYNGAWVQVFTG
ncbi:CAP domain-containing protein [Paenibacillus tarimensis]